MTIASVIDDTPNGFAARWGVEYPVANNLINLFKTKGLAKEVGTKPNPTGKGRGSTVWRPSCQLHTQCGEWTSCGSPL
jgi:hypothetical protein